MAVDMPVRAIREQIIAGIDLVVQIARMPDGVRRVTHITEVGGLDPETGQIITDDVFVLRGGRHTSGDTELCHTGFIPTFTDKLIREGLLGVEVFTQ